MVMFLLFSLLVILLQNITPSVSYRIDARVPRQAPTATQNPDKPTKKPLIHFDFDFSHVLSAGGSFSGPVGNHSNETRYLIHVDQGKLNKI